MKHDARDERWRIGSPPVPIWVAGTSGNARQIERAARWDGFFPLEAGRSPEPARIRDALAVVARLRGSLRGFDLLACGVSGEGDASVACALEAGATWWLEWPAQGQDALAMRERIRLGPARL